MEILQLGDKRKEWGWREQIFVLPCLFPSQKLVKFLIANAVYPTSFMKSIKK